MRVGRGKMAVCLMLGLLILAGICWAYIAKKDSAVAVYRGGTITEHAFSDYLRIQQFYTPGTSQKLKDPAYLKQSLHALIASDILSQRGRKMADGSQQAQAARQWETYKLNYEHSFSYEGKPLEVRLTELDLNTSMLKTYLENQLYGQLYLQSTVSGTQLKKDYELNKAQHLLDRYDLKQIWIAFAPPNAPRRSDENAFARARYVADQLRSGGHFTELAKQYSDDPQLAQHSGVYTDTPLYALDSDIQQAILQLPLHQVSEPLKSEGGYYVIELDGKSSKTYAQAIEEIKSSYVQSAYADFMTNELPGFINREQMELPTKGGER